ncbi:FkbM family methyltransferase, partial [Candidatus Pacearchaeota archaeon]|nr:FkbM family methyltransferase [Candidatus Pacearchaeota archaeon]
MKSIYQFLLNKIKNDYSFTLIDVGAMGGIAKKWDDLSGFIKIIGFEPDDREFSKLKNSDNLMYFNYILYDKSQDLNFFIAKGHGKSSIYKPNLDIISQFEDADRYNTEYEETLSSEKVKTLDSVINDNSILDIDFIKLDTQGTELNILAGGENCVLPKLFGAQIEVEFIEIYKDQPTFKDVDEFMQKNGFQLIDLRRQYWN